MSRPVYLCTVLALFALAALTLTACTPKADPFVVGDRRAMAEGTATPRPTPADVPAGTPVPSDVFSRYDIPARGTIKFAQWDDKPLQIVNFVAGYLAVYGYIYSVNLVETPPESYTASLGSGAVDVVFDFDKEQHAEWYTANVGGGKFFDLGSAFPAKPDSRVVAFASMADALTDIVDVFRVVSPDGPTIDRIAAMMTGGRTGISQSVAALIYFKENEAVWTAWVSPDVAAHVKQAIEDNRNSLKRKCLRAGMTGYPCTD